MVQLPAVDQLLAGVDAPLLGEQLGQLRIAGGDLLARRVGRAMGKLPPAAMAASISSRRSWVSRTAPPMVCSAAKRRPTSVYWRRAQRRKRIGKFIPSPASRRRTIRPLSRFSAPLQRRTMPLMSRREALLVKKGFQHPVQSYTLAAA